MALRRLSSKAFIFLLLVFSTQLQARDLPDFVQLVKDNSPAVVNISTTHKVNAHPWGNIDIPNLPENSPFHDFFRHFFGEDGVPMPPQQDATSLGSGFIISRDGYVITNFHVIEDAEEIMVRLSDKRELKAEVIGGDEYTDIALLKVSATDLPVVKIGSSESIQVGAWVLAIGSPFGFDHSVTAGIVSAKGRSLPRANYVPFIQTDVAINPGNSGGPLFDLDGKVIGINSQIYSRTGGFMGLSFAIPIDVAMDVVQQIKEKGEVSRGWLGVYIQEVTKELAESFGLDKPVGALVSQVIENSPAQKYGIRAGDVILSFNGKAILDSSDLPPMVGRVPVGSKAKVRLLRDGKQKTLEVVIEQLPDEKQPTASLPDQKPLQQENRLGVDVSDLSKSQRVELGRGVRVDTVDSDSPAQQAGIRPGDIILQINRQDINSVADFRSKVEKLPADRMIPILVQRRGSDQFLVLKLPPEE
ncbi:MAG: DegQ family serine endoprotease [Gammaproteobacteria bacterium]|nr:MAG: DegQ family serine endoprotease [Gammaproteobacteria bacterium]